MGAVNKKGASRIEVISKSLDPRAEAMRKKLQSKGFCVSSLHLADAYTIDPEINVQSLDEIAEKLYNPLTQHAGISNAPEKFDFAVEISCLPGVTDNPGLAAKEAIFDSSEWLPVYSSRMIFLSGKLARKDADEIAGIFSNPLIQKASVKSYGEFIRDKGMIHDAPKVMLYEKPNASIVEIINADDGQLKEIGSHGIANPDGTRRGSLSMSLLYMKAVQDYFSEKGRNPTDLGLESTSQTWSEHCKHTIFADPIDEIKEGLFKTYIKGATEVIRKKKGSKDFCVSVFTDNAGGIIFDDDFLVCDKVETHNYPSTIDPLGGSGTGILGVIRDIIGFGMGAKPIIAGFGLCSASSDDKTELYKGENKTQKMLSAERIIEGVVSGINEGGNYSGIPVTQGFVFFDQSYRGRPLVFARGIGLIPREANGKKMHEKKANSGDYVVMVGGRVGKDGIHGATFSSEAMGSGSPATAVQIGDPMIQKKMCDALINEARDMGLYTSITDNGAGGLSCSVAEMAKESGGCYVNLDKVPLKYKGLAPWEIWISESQERMTLAVPKEKWEAFSALMEKRDVEATVIGEFTDSGKCIVDYNGKNVMDIDMDFLHNGLPKRHMHTSFSRKVHEEPEFSCLEDLTDTLHSMLKRPNLASFEFVSQQYDHEVQGGSVIKPLQGKGRVNGDATVVRPRPGSKKAVLLSHGINPSYSEIDTYDMAACAIDTAVRNSVAAGADLEHLALLDNFCWCSSDEPERLGQLKRAAKACYETAVAYHTPFISGKDSMFNDFNGFDESGKPVKISALPTLLISSVGVIEDAEKSISIDAKFGGDLVYVLGETHEELGGSEYFAMKGEQERGEKYIGNNVPKVDAEKNLSLYMAFSSAAEKGLAGSAISIHRGGMAVALAKSAVAGQVGMELDLTGIPSSCSRDDYEMFSETQGRLVVTVSPENREMFEEAMQGSAFFLAGRVTNDKNFRITKKGKEIVNTSIDSLAQSYRKDGGY